MGRCGCGANGCGGRCANAPQFGAIAARPVTQVPWNGLRGHGVGKAVIRARARYVQGVGGIGAVPHEVRVSEVRPSMPRGYEALQKDSRFFQAQLGKLGRLGAAVTWSIASPQVQNYARLARTARTFCDSYTSRTSNFDFNGRGWYRLSLLDTLMYCLAVDEAWPTYKDWLMGRTTDATRVLGIVNTLVGLIDSIPGARAAISHLPAPVATLISVLTSEWSQTVTERDMFQLRDAGPTFNILSILAKEGRVLPGTYTMPGAAGTAGMSTGAKVAIVVAVVALLGAGGYALSQRQPSYLRRAA